MSATYVILEGILASLLEQQPQEILTLEPHSHNGQITSRITLSIPFTAANLSNVSL